MAYSQENPYVKTGSVPQHLPNAGKKHYDQAYTDGFSAIHSVLGNSPVHLIHAPNDRTPITQHARNDRTPITQHAICPPRPAQTVQVIIPSPWQMSGTANSKPLNGSVVSSGAGLRPPPVDYQLLLLSLAEDYFTAAHGESSFVALNRRHSDAQAYYKLIATGLGCLEAVLKHWRQQPLLEAKVRLRYATVLHDETENSMEAEEALSKGITICDRLRNFDLKYNMQHLLARVLYRRNPRAALRYLDGIVGDVEAYQHVTWNYAFRFLRISLCLESSTHQDILSAINHLRAISTISERYGDKAVLAVAATLEALIYLRLSTSAESIEQAQRALAMARSSQLDPAVAQIPQLAAMMHFVDLCWSLRTNDPIQAILKLQAMQTTLETIHDGGSWTESGTFFVPISHSQGLLPASHTGIVRDGTDNSRKLLLDWVPKEDIYNLGFLLSGICTAHKNTLDGFKSEQMLKEGVRRQEASLKSSAKLSQPLSHAVSCQSWRQLQTCHMRLHLAFALCARTSWSAASDQLSLLKDTLDHVQSDIPADLRIIVQYLEGVIYQGTGSLDAALNIFLSPSFSLPEPHKPAPSHTHLDLSILAALNSLLITRSRTLPPFEVAPLISRLEPLCKGNPSKGILSAYNLILATIMSDDTIVHQKQCLQNALQAAKACLNNQLMCFTLNLMSWKFFRGVVGQQAEKSARASQSLAQKGKDVLWTSVSAGLLADTLEIQGRPEEAEAVRAEGRRFAGALPEAVQRLET